MNRALALVPALVLALASASCGGDTEDDPTITAPSASSSTTTPPPASTSASTSAPAADGTGLRVGDFSFSPRTLTVRTGTVISLRNSGRTAHTWTSKPGGPIVFDVDLSEPGQTATFSTSEVGTVDFVCTIHEARGMTGTLVVTA